MGIREGQLGRGAVVDGVIANGPLAVCTGLVGCAVGVIIQAIARKGQHIGKIAGIKRIGHGNIIGRGAIHTAAARLVGQGNTVDIGVVGIAVICQRDEMGAGRTGAVQAFITHFFDDGDVRLGDGE